MNREELAALDAKLPLDEVLHFRLRTAMRHSYLLQSREYANTVISILNTIAVNAHSPLPRNTEAIIKGEPVRIPDTAVAHALLLSSTHCGPVEEKECLTTDQSLYMQIVPFLSDPSVPVRFCACMSIPRIGFNILLERPDKAVLFGALTGCSASLDVSSCCYFAIESSEVGIRAGHGTAPTTDGHVRGTHLLHSPCLSFAQLQHSYHPHQSGAKTQIPSSMKSQTFLHGKLEPCGVVGPGADADAPCAPFDTVNLNMNLHTPSNSGNAFRGSSYAGEAHSDRDYFPSPSGSAASHEVPVIHEELRWSQRDRQIRATELLKQRIQQLRGDVLLGTVSATIAPLEAFIDSVALVRLLELGMQLCSEVRQGDVFFQQCVNGP